MNGSKRNISQALRGFFVTLTLLEAPGLAQATSFVLPGGGDNVVGALGLTQANYEDTLSDLARAYNQGFWELRLANQAIDAWIPGEDTEVLIPSQFILPNAPTKGIVINVPEMRLYYYPNRESSVITVPISIGRQDWATPHGATRVVGKHRNPSWRPPASIRREHAEMGDPLPAIVPGGPDNPLGEYAMSLGVRGYLIHGTNKPYGIGMRVTHGCIRLYPEDIAYLFGRVATGTTVRIVNQPFKIGRLNGLIYLEVHPFLEEDPRRNENEEQRVFDAIFAESGGQSADIDWDKVRLVIEAKNGIPTVVSRASGLSPVEDPSLNRASLESALRPSKINVIPIDDGELF